MNKQELRKKAALPKDTLVLTLNGYAKIQELNIGDLVVCWNEREKIKTVQPIIETFSMMGEKFIEIETSTQKFKVSPKTIFTLADRTLMQADHLIDFSEVLSLEDPSKIFFTINEKEEIIITYNIMVETNNNFYITTEDILVEGIQRESSLTEEIDELLTIQYN